MKVFFKLLKANFLQFSRDRASMFFTFAFPLLFMLIFGFVFANEDNVSYQVGLAVEDNSQAAAAIAGAVKQVPIFEITEGELEPLLDSFREGDLSAVIVIPEGLQASVGRGQTAEITVYHDPSQTASSQVVLSVMNEVIDSANRQLTGEPVLLKLATQSLQARDLRYIDFLVPGILAMSILFLGLFGALPMVEWREKQVLKRLGATPASRLHIVSSQVIYRLVLAVIQTLIIVAVAFFVFHVQMVGSWPLLYGMVVLGALTFVSLGYLAVARAKTVEGAMPLVQFIQFPMLFLSGIFFPLDFVPDFMKPIVSAMPLTYLGDVLRQVMVGSTPGYPILVDIAVMTGWLLVSMFISIRIFRWD